MRDRSIILIVLFSIVASPSRGQADGLRGSATVNYNLNRSELNGSGQSSYSIEQRYHLGTEKELSALLKFRSDIRDLESLNETDLGTSRRRSIEPFSEFILRNPLFQWSTGYRMRRDSSEDPSGDKKTVNNHNLYSRFLWRPGGLPPLNLRYEKTKSFDDLDPNMLDTEQDHFFASSDYSIGPVSALDNFTFRRTKNNVSKIVVEDLQNLGTLNLQKHFWKRRIHFTGNYQVDYRRQETVAEVDVTVYETRSAQAGLYSRMDDTPAEGILESTPGLIDGNKASPALDPLGSMINIGAGHTFRNIGLQLRRPEVVSTINVYVRAGDPDLSQVLGWALYLSDDGRNWRALGASVVFNASESRYELSFSESNPHAFFKVVNTSTSALIDSFVTEIEAVGPELLSAESKRVRTILDQNFNTNVRFIPIEWLNIGHDFYYNKIRREEDSSIFKEERNRHGIGLQMEPFWWIAADFRYDRSFSRSEQEVERLSNLYAATFRSSPLETLSASVSITRNEASQDKRDQFRLDSVLLHITSKLYRDLNLAMDLGYSDNKDFTTGIKTINKTLRMDLDARVRKDLTATLNYDSLWSLKKPPKTSTHRDVTSLLLIWRPTRLLNLSGEWVYRRESDGDIFSQRYRLDWLPFPDGKIDLNLNYELETQRSEQEHTQRHRLIASVRWAINRSTDLRVAYTMDRSEDHTSERIQNLNVSLDIRF